MGHITSIFTNEKGSVLVLALLVLVLLTLMGISATTTSTIEVQMAGNDKVHEIAFYAAESGWQSTLNWLDGQFPAVTQNVGWNDDGTGTFDVDHFNAPDSISLSDGNNAQYSPTITFVGTTHVPGYGPNFRRFNYMVNSTGTGPGNARTVVRVTAGKVFDMGGY